MNPFDADCCLYFYKRKKSKMLVTLKGRKSLLYLWEKQGHKCPICGESIDTHKAWDVMPTVQNGKNAICWFMMNVLNYPANQMETRSSLSQSLHTNRGLEKLEPYEGKLSCTVLRGGERAAMPLTYPIDRPTCNSVTDGELEPGMRLPSILPGTTWMS